VASDIIFIALRDSRTRELRRTLAGLLLGDGTPPLCRALLLAYEERLCRDEQAFMEGLGLGLALGEGASGREGDGDTAPSSPDQGTAGRLRPEAEPPDLLDTAMLAVEELHGDAVALAYEHSLKGAGGHADTDLWSPSLFWEPPPVRLFILRARPGHAAAAGVGVPAT